MTSIKTTLLSFVSICFALIFLTPGAEAQNLLAEFKLEGLFGPIGSRVGTLGDLEGDGYTDMLVAGAEGVFIVSGVDGAKVKHIHVGPEALIRVTGIGDVDDDMIPDIAVSDWDTVRAYSTATGEKLWTVAGSLGGAMGDTLVALGDVNDDQVPDLAAGEPDADPLGMNSAGKVHILSGDTGLSLNVIKGTYYYERVGDYMDSIKDLNNDGKTDLLIGDPEFHLSGPNKGRVRAVSAIDGAEIFSIEGTVADSGFGVTVVDAGDIDGDNLSDLAIASSIPGMLDLFSSATRRPIWSEPIATAGLLISVEDLNDDNLPDLVAARFAFFPFYQGEADVIDGATGAILKSLTGGFDAFNSIASPGDLNDDGKPELVATQFAALGSQDPNATVFTLPDFATHYTITNPSGGDGLGAAVDVVSDLDGDGTNDYILGSSTRLMVFAGDGSGPILDLGVGTPNTLGAADVMGFDDLTGDDIPEIFFSDGNWGTGSQAFAGRMVILSGADGSVVEEIPGNIAEHFAYQITPTIDRDGDGVRDLFVSVTGMPLSGLINAGEVRLLSGATRDTLQVYQTTHQKYGAFGLSLTANGDVDEDGIPDLAVGSSMDMVSPFTTGAFYIVSGKTGDALYRIDGDPGSYTLYGDIIGDADGDGVADFISAEPFWAHPEDPTDSDRGRVQAWSGADGSMLWQAEGSDTDDRFGWPARGAGDVNGDGYMDVVVSAPMGGTAGVGELLLLSGKDGSELDRTDLPVGASAVATVGYFDQGGSSDVIVGLPQLDKNGGARIYASNHGGLHGFVDLGHALAGTSPAAPQLKAYGDLSPNGQVSLKVRRVEPNAFGYWFFSLDQGTTPFRGGVFVPDPMASLFIFPVFSNADGEFTYNGINPPGVPSGLELVHQFWFVDAGGPQGASATNGMGEIFK